MTNASLHASAFDYVSPTDKQKDKMADARAAALAYSQAIERLVPIGPDRTHALRLLRTVAMWVNVAITRDADGKPRTDTEVEQH